MISANNRADLAEMAARPSAKTLLATENIGSEDDAQTRPSAFGNPGMLITVSS